MLPTVSTLTLVSSVLQPRLVLIERYCAQSDGHDPNSLDLSWTAAYPLNVGWLLNYYGDIATARKYWPSLKLFCEGQIRMAENVTADGLVDFWTYG